MNLSNKSLVKILSVLIALLVLLTFSACTMVLNCTDEQAEHTAAVSKPSDETYNIVVGGTDKGGGRTDVIMLAHVNITDKTASIVSIPRDTYINTKHSAKKINACNAIGGAEELCRRVEETFGIGVDYYAIVELKVFSQLVDAIGGVEVTLSRDMHYEDSSQGLYIDLKAGRQVLNGNEAECFVRFRSGYAMADLTRIEAQKIFVAALAKKLLSSESISHLPQIISAVFQNLETDMDAVKMISMALRLYDISLENVKIYTMPGEAYTKNGVSYYSLYKAEALTLINEKFNSTGTEITEQQTTIIELGRRANNKFDYNGKSLAQLAQAESPKK